MSPPVHLWESWADGLAALRAARCRCVFADFDGTLVPLRRHRGVPQLSRSVARLLARLPLSCTAAGIASGRRLDDLWGRVGIPGLWYIGDHGFSLLSPQGQRRLWSRAAEQRRVRRAAQELAERLHGLPGIEIEEKEATVAVHYRQAPPRAVQRARVGLEALLATHRGLHLMEGNKVWELLPNDRINKWTALQQVLRRVGCRASEGWLVYVGDDTTDECVFQGMEQDRWRGLSIVVGQKAATAARYFLRSPGEVKVFLRRWVQLFPPL